jgi:phosphomannomutase/phosphoglucomutase
LTMVNNANIFKKYDIRGRAAGEGIELDNEAALAVGRAFATYVQSIEQIETVVVGRDNRGSSYDLQHALMQGLRSSGCRVIDIGLVGTPLVYWHAVQEGNIGGVMVTGSHLPADQNGLKFCAGSRAVFGDELTALKEIIEKDNYYYGSGDLVTDSGAYTRYVRDLAGRIRHQHSLKVVIDAGNGVGGLFAPRLLELWGHQLLDCLYCEPNAAYPNHHPNPQREENMRDLAARVRDLGADVGIAFDGDADRIGAVDEQGHLIPADRLLALLARDLLGRHPAAVVVTDVSSSQVVADVVESFGGRALMAPSGHALVKDVMRQHNGMLGGEQSGHLFFKENYFGFDDGFFAMGRLLQLIGQTGKRLSELEAELPTYYSSPVYRPACPDEDKQKVINGVARHLESMGKVIRVDGVRIQFDKGWGLLRASNTEPVLSLRFEAETETDALIYRDLFVRALRQYPQVAALED